MNKRIFLLEDDAGAAIITDVLEIKFGYSVDRARNIVDMIWFLEDNQTEYLAILLDIAVDGDEFIDNKGNNRQFNDPEGMNGLEYYRQERERTLAPYEGRIGFYSAWTQRLKNRADREEIPIEGCMLFDKNNSNMISQLANWLKELENE